MWNQNWTDYPIRVAVNLGKDAKFVQKCHSSVWKCDSIRDQFGAWILKTGLGQGQKED